MNYEVGDLIRYMPNSGPPRVGVVVSKEADIKNGRPGFDICTPSGEYFWGYDDQILGVDRADDPKELL